MGGPASSGAQSEPRQQASPGAGNAGRCWRRCVSTGRGLTGAGCPCPHSAAQPATFRPHPSVPAIMGCTPLQMDPRLSARPAAAAGGGADSQGGLQAQGRAAPDARPAHGGSRPRGITPSRQCCRCLPHAALSFPCKGSSPPPARALTRKLYPLQLLWVVWLGVPGHLHRLHAATGAPPRQHAPRVACPGAACSACAVGRLPEQHMCCSHTQQRPWRFCLRANGHGSPAPADVYSFCCLTAQVHPFCCLLTRCAPFEPTPFNSQNTGQRPHLRWPGTACGPAAPQSRRWCRRARHQSRMCRRRACRRPRWRTRRA